MASQYAGVPVINAGDGSHSHPTQTLTDLLTIKREKGRFDNMTIGFCGDLKFGRTVHSLIKALSRYSGIKVILIAPQELRLPDYMLAEMSENSKLEFREVETMEEVMPELDVLYMTRVQKERFLDEEEFDRVKNSFVLNPEKLGTAKKDMIILHPLPRVNEITRAVDNDSRAAYFRQVENGKFVRMALILTLLRWADRNKPFERTRFSTASMWSTRWSVPTAVASPRRRMSTNCSTARPTAPAAAPTARPKPGNGLAFGLKAPFEELFFMSGAEKNGFCQGFPALGCYYINGRDLWNKFCCVALPGVWRWRVWPFIFCVFRARILHTFLIFV